MQRPKYYEEYSDEELNEMCDKSIKEYNSGKSIDSKDVEKEFKKNINSEDKK